MTYRVKNITIAAALALVAALLTMFYVTNYQRSVRENEENVPVFVAARDIPAGTAGADLVGRGFVEKTEIVRRSVVPGAISNPEQLDGLVATQAVYAGEQVSTRRFTTPSQRGIKAQLTGVQRAIAVQGDQHMLLAGVLKAGDRVDVVATFNHPQGSQFTFTRIVLRDIEVLKAPASAGAAEKISSGADGGFAVTLKVTDTQAHKLHWVYTSAEKWHLELRPGTKPADSPDNVEGSLSIITDGVKTNQLDRAGVGAASQEGSE
jgi:Flp pilus assembly protein CpaB